ncbi:MAG: hypothetical protein Kow002_15610 [Anaerolineales bacterium]
MDTLKHRTMTGLLLAIGVGVALAVSLDNLAIGIGVGLVFAASFIVRQKSRRNDLQENEHEQKT